MQSNKTAHELSSYLSCLDKGFEPEIFVEHGEVWARYARQGGRPQIADAIDKRTAAARRECAAKLAAAPGRLAPTTTPTTPSRASSGTRMDLAELRAVAAGAYAAIAAENQAKIDDMYAGFAAKLNARSARATSPASAVEQAVRASAAAFSNAPAPNPQRLADSPRTARPSQSPAEIAAMRAALAAKLNAGLPAHAFVPGRAAL